MEERKPVQEKAAPNGNNKIGARKHDGFKAISTAPSINRTPIGPTMVPIPYPTVQDLSNSANTARTVNFNGCPAYLLDITTQPRCTGDEPGTGKGIKSGTVSGEVKPIKGSRTVRIESKQVLREGDPCTMNGGNNPGVYVTTCSPSVAPPKTAVQTSDPPIVRKTLPNSLVNPPAWDADNPLGLPVPQSLSEKLAAQMQRETLSGTSGMERLKRSMRSWPKGPQLVPWDPAMDSAKQLRTTNNLETALLGIFGGPGVAARLAGQSEEKIAAANQVGFAAMGLALSVATMPSRQPISIGPRTTPAMRSTVVGGKSNSGDGVRIVGCKGPFAAARRSAGESYKKIVASVKGTVVGEYDALNPGPLPANRAETFSGGRYADIVLSEDTVVYRAWSPGTWAAEDGGYWSLEKPIGSLQTRIDSALLPEWGGGKPPFSSSICSQATDWTAIKLPAGTAISVGEVGGQRGVWVGGGSQLLIKGGPDLSLKIDGGKLK
ncbi:DUF4150 domain-containing protein [Duganella sp. HSC-15S17]|nr:DUF4150 domain-containing protein [Duganella violaceicalia]